MQSVKVRLSEFGAKRGGESCFVTNAGTDAMREVGVLCLRSAQCSLSPTTSLSTVNPSKMHFLAFAIGGCLLHIQSDAFETRACIRFGSIGCKAWSPLLVASSIDMRQSSCPSKMLSTFDVMSLCPYAKVWMPSSSMNILLSNEHSPRFLV